jgi:hypothetical protein
MSAVASSPTSPGGAAAFWNRMPAVPPHWRSENALMLAGLTLSAVLLIAFCAVVSGVVRSAEAMHQSSVQPVDSTANRQGPGSDERPG